MTSRIAALPVRMIQERTDCRAFFVQIRMPCANGVFGNYRAITGIRGAGFSLRSGDETEKPGQISS